MPAKYRIEEGMDVYGRNGEKVGEVGQVVVGTESKEPRFFTIEQGFVFQTDYLVPREAVTRVTDDGAFIGLTEAQVKSMPEWDGNAPTRDEIRDAYENLGARREEPDRYRLDNLPFPGAESPQVEGSQGTLESHAERPAGGVPDAAGEGPDAVLLVVEECVVLSPEERERQGYATEWTDDRAGGPA